MKSTKALDDMKDIALTKKPQKCSNRRSAQRPLCPNKLQNKMGNAIKRAVCAAAEEGMASLKAFCAKKTLYPTLKFRRKLDKLERLSGQISANVKKKVKKSILVQKRNADIIPRKN